MTAQINISSIRFVGLLLRSSIFFACLTVLVFLLTAESASCAGGAVGVPTLAQAPVADKLPANIDIYATADIGGGKQCLVGAKSDADGLNERPMVYLVGSGGKFAWHVQLPILKGSYQGRATHCVVSTDALYVLLQIDTYPQQNLNQGVLQVVALNKKTGAVIASKYIDVPNVSADYTSWVEQGGDNFKLERAKLVIKGLYELMSERDHPSEKPPIPFTVEISTNLR